MLNENGLTNLHFCFDFEALGYHSYFQDDAQSDTSRI